MRKFFISLGASIFVCALTACGGHMSMAPPTAPSDTSGDVTQSVAANLGLNVVRACSAIVPIGYARCDSLVRTDIGGANLAPDLVSPDVNGQYRPTDLRSAYKLPSTTAGSGQTVAIVDAFNDPTAESDMNKYRSTFALGACTTANGCFKKVNQNGVQGSYPSTNDGWALEISLDLDMVSAICPKCKIILVETASNAFSNLGAGDNRAVTMGARQVSNSFGGSEFASSSSAFNHPDHILTASAGDNGTGAQQPCSFATVVCVGGTHLIHASNTRGWSESAWSGSGSGCSAFVAKPSWQHDPSCHKRSEADISAVADPNTGVLVYDSTPIPGAPHCTPPNCFWIVGGTSASSPIIAAAYALKGNASTLSNAQTIWTHGGTSALFDVTSGSNGSCSITYICHAQTGYDGPTGWGTPNNTTAL